MAPLGPGLLRRPPSVNDLVRPRGFRDEVEAPRAAGRRYPAAVARASDRQAVNGQKEPDQCRDKLQRHGDVTDKWKEVYLDFLRVRNLRLRPGITLEQFATILSSLAEGMTLRNTCDSGPSLSDPVRHVSLLGTAVLSVTIGCLDWDDGLTVEEKADSLMDPRSDGL